jgi:alpha-mannosidase II
MLNLYDKLPFDNLDGGVWTQGFPIEYDQEKIKKEKRLEVIVVPHSHCDPGTLTFLFVTVVFRMGLDIWGILQHENTTCLKQDAQTLTRKAGHEIHLRRNVIFWALVVDDQRRTKRTDKKVSVCASISWTYFGIFSLLRSGHLEIVTGGWVMTDEANARSFSIVMELIEGHEFLLNQLQYRPKSHWSIDPFGLSPTLTQMVSISEFWAYFSRF